MNAEYFQVKRKRSNAFHCDGEDEDPIILLQTSYNPENPYDKQSSFAAFKKKKNSKVLNIKNNKDLFACDEYLEGFDYNCEDSSN